MSYFDWTTPKEWDEACEAAFKSWAAKNESANKTWDPEHEVGSIAGAMVAHNRHSEETPVMPEDSKTRKGIPLHGGLLAYFPSALASVAQLSRVCNDKHNPGLPLQWSKENSNDHQDALLRHLVDAAADPAARDPEDGTLLAAKVAWRALAQLQVMHDSGIDIFAEE